MNDKLEFIIQLIGLAQKEIATLTQVSTVSVHTGHFLDDAGMALGWAVTQLTKAKETETA